METMQGPSGQPQWGPSPWEGIEAPGHLVGNGTARRARMAVPYLGPDPAPSRITGRALMAALACSSILRVGLAFAYLQRASLDRQLAAGTIGVEGLRGSTGLLGGLALAQLASWFVIIGLLVAWTRARRPKATLLSLGEAYVESPLRWISTVPVRVAFFAIAAAAIAAGLAGNIAPHTPVVHDAVHRDWTAAACGIWAVYYAVFIGVILASERALQSRIAESGAHRMGLAPIPFVPAVLTRAERHQLKMEDQRQQQKPESFGWFLRTSGLILLCFVGGFGLVFTVAAHTAASLGSALVFLVIDVLVVRAFVRRYRTNHPKLTEAPLPQFPLNG